MFAQGYNAAILICVIHSPPFFLSLLRGLHPVMATFASGYDLIRICWHHLSHVHWTPSYPIPIANKVIYFSGSRGYSPSACHLVEKVTKWEGVNLADLLKDHSSPDQLIVINGQILSVPDQKPCSINRVIGNIYIWIQACNVFTAILLSAEDTTKEEAAGRVAPSYLILQMSRDLQGSQWLQYDQNFREWAAAKGIRK